MAAIPNVELVDIPQDRGFGYVCGGPAARHPERERELHRKVAENAAAAGVDVLVTMYHACHRQLSGAEAHYPFAVKNFTDLMAEALGLGGRHDYYKQYKRGGEMDEAIAAARDLSRGERRGARRGDGEGALGRDIRRGRHSPAAARPSRKASPRSPGSRRLAASSPRR